LSLISRSLPFICSMEGKSSIRSRHVRIIYCILPSMVLKSVGIRPFIPTIRFFSETGRNEINNETGEEEIKKLIKINTKLQVNSGNNAMKIKIEVAPKAFLFIFLSVGV